MNEAIIVDTNKGSLICTYTWPETLIHSQYPKKCAKHFTVAATAKLNLNFYRIHGFEHPIINTRKEYIAMPEMK